MTILPASRSLVVKVLWFCSLVTMFAAPLAFAAQMSPSFPDDIDPSANYLFFLHNYYVEVNGPDGDCKYEDLLQAFVDEDFFVVSEIRSGKIVPCTYASKTAAQVNALLAAGVPPQNITVAGHSKGGVIALCVASQLQNEGINYVIMAGCEIEGIKKYNMYPDFSNLKGRVLSVYADSDTVAGSCGQAFSMSVGGLTDTEMKISSDQGHRLFFAPSSVWLTPVSGWLKQ